MAQDERGAVCYVRKGRCIARKDMRMWDVLSMFGCIAMVFVGIHGLGWLLDFLNDPEQALERLGRLVAAFRRGLTGKAPEPERTDTGNSPEPGRAE